MLQNAYLLAKIGADTAENEQYFAKNLRKTDLPAPANVAPESRRPHAHAPAIFSSGGPAPRLEREKLRCAMKSTHRTPLWKGPLSAVSKLLRGWDTVNAGYNASK